MWFKKNKKNVQEHQKLSPEEDQSSIGNLAITSGFVESNQFKELLKEFKSTTPEMLLGQFLVGKGKLTQSELEILLIKQERIRANGGLGRQSVMKILEAADRTQLSVSKEVDEFYETTARLLNKITSK